MTFVLYMTLRDYACIPLIIIFVLFYFLFEKKILYILSDKNLIITFFFVFCIMQFMCIYCVDLEKYKFIYKLNYR